MNRKFGKNDILLLSVLLLAVLGFLVGMTFLLGTGECIEITVAGEHYGTYLLSQEQEIEIRQDGEVTNIVRIQDGRAYMLEADCPDQLCCHQRAVHRAHESIICLPNRVVVTVRGADEGEIDSMAR